MKRIDGKAKSTENRGLGSMASAVADVVNDTGGCVPYVPPRSPIHDRRERQAQVLSWVYATLGPQSAAVSERVLRFLEEAIELAQAEGLPVELARKVLEHVYAKPPGEPSREAGGVGVTLLAYCEAAHIDATQAEVDEFARVKALPAEHVIEAQAATKKILAGKFCQSCGAWLGCLGLEPDYRLYVAHLNEVFREVRRVLRDDGTLWLNLGDSYATGAGNVGECPGGGAQGERWNGYRGSRDKDPKSVAIGPLVQPNRLPQPGLKPKDLVGIPWRIALALQSDGWFLRSDIIWSKPNPMPESVTDRPTKSHEYLFLFAKAANYYYDAEAIKEQALDTGRVKASPRSRLPTFRSHVGRAAEPASPRPAVSRQTRGDVPAVLGRSNPAGSRGGPPPQPRGRFPRLQAGRGRRSAGGRGGNRCWNGCRGRGRSGREVAGDLAESEGRMRSLLTIGPLYALELVSHAMDTSRIELRQRSNLKSITQPRWIAMWLLRQPGTLWRQLSYHEIANALGLRNHTSAIHGVRKVETSPVLLAQAREILARVAGERKEAA